MRLARVNMTFGIFQWVVIPRIAHPPANSYFYPFNPIMTLKQKISAIAISLCMTPDMRLRKNCRNGMDSMAPVLRIR